MRLESRLTFAAFSLIKPPLHFLEIEQSFGQNIDSRPAYWTIERS